MNGGPHTYVLPIHPGGVEPLGLYCYFGAEWPSGVKVTGETC